MPPGNTDISQTAEGAYQRHLDSYFNRAARYWDEIYSRQDISAAIYQERLKRVLELSERLELAPGSRVLEIGCGAGWTAVALAQRGCLVDAADTVPAMLASTRLHAGEAGVGDRVRPIFADTHRLPFGDASFHLVLAIGVIPWLPAAAPAIREMSRVLEQEGQLIVSADHTWGLSRIVEPLTNPLAWMFKPVIRKLIARRDAGARSVLSSRKEIDSALAAAGLQKISSLTLGFGPFTVARRRLLSDTVGLRLHRRLQALADRGVPVFRSGGAHYLVAARKV
jgi:ubiquinone/menaquinone biosynthesis C-methylase UbiE